ncbi:Exodeoxyribonuclease 7 small subunit [Rhodocyclaceae bacterium]|nr:Exodeoxyribonuclease 7 small subunit [Rhodocyclaceae bacterium]
MPGNTAKNQTKSQKALSFEAALAELEQVVADMEAGQLPLEESLAAYKRGAELLQHCRGQLEDAQLQVRMLEEGTLKNFADNLAGNLSGAGDAVKREDA